MADPKKAKLNLLELANLLKDTDTAFFEKSFRKFVVEKSKKESKEVYS